MTEGDDMVVVTLSSEGQSNNNKSTKKLDKNNSNKKENNKKNNSAKKGSPSPSTSTGKRSVSFEDIEVFEYNAKLVKEQRSRFDLLTKRHMWRGSPLELLGDDSTTDDNDNNKNNNDAESVSSPKEEEKKKAAVEGLDPLSAMLMEQQEQEEKNRKVSSEQPQSTSSIVAFKAAQTQQRTSSNWSMFYSSRELITMIQKDLDRLPPFHHQTTAASQANDTKDLNGSFSSGDNGCDLKREERKSVLLQILFMYAKEYPDIGYRQGMHEILSFTLLAIELDYSSYQESFSNTATTSSLLFNSVNTLHDTYTLFEMIMYHLSPAYDAAILKRPPHCTPQIARRARPSSSPMQAMGISILAKVRRSAGDPLYKLLSHTINVPPQLYCTRWVRLMLARELSSVAGVLSVWDSFFSLISPHPNSSTLMEVLEFASAVMILMCKDPLLSNGEHVDVNDSIQLLMNYPPITNADVFLSQLRNMVFSTLGVDKYSSNTKHNNNNSRSPHTSQKLQYSGSLNNKNHTVEHTVEGTIDQVHKSWSKAFQSLGGQYHNIVHNVEKTYKAAISTSLQQQKNENTSICNIDGTDSNKDLQTTMTLNEIETTLDESIMIFKTFVRCVSNELSSNENKDIPNSIPMQQEVIEAITKLQKVKMNIRGFNRDDSNIYSMDNDEKKVCVVSDSGSICDSTTGDTLVEGGSD